MNEIGFWDYTCPRHGSLERYNQADWDLLLDDMASGGFNSLVLGIKWLTTGYRSRLPWLDQDPSCSAITSDNALIHGALRGAKQRGLRTSLLLVATVYPAGPLALPGGIPYAPEWVEGFQVYDLDVPGLAERIDILFGEVVDLFGAEIDRIVVELEFCDGEAPHRIAAYDEWARQNGRPRFAEIKNIRLEPRAYPYTHWRDFTTSRRIETLRRIEEGVRDRGFQGSLASIIELDNQPAAVLGNVNLSMLASALPGWPVVTYDSIYDRRRNRLATMDFCVHQPHLSGLQAYYLTRGVMTFHIPPDLPPTTLEEQWRMSLEDAQAHAPDALWFMGADARLDGLVCSGRKLPQSGFADPRTARLRLMEIAREMRVNQLYSAGRSESCIGD
jgi:hypothetical protein